MHKNASGRDDAEFVCERLVDQVRELTPNEHRADERERRETTVQQYDDSYRREEHDDKVLNRTHTAMFIARRYEPVPLRQPCRRTWDGTVPVADGRLSWVERCRAN